MSKKKKKKKSAQEEYYEFKSKEIKAHHILALAAAANLEAMNMALKQNDVTAMATVAEGWTQLAINLLAIENEIPAPSNKIGFHDE